MSGEASDVKDRLVAQGVETPAPGVVGDGRGNRSGHARRYVRNGLLFGAAAHLSWGLFPLYFKALAHVPPLEVLAHRVVWASVFLLALVAVTGRWGTVVAAVRSGRSMAVLACSTVLIAVNWYVYIWAVTNGQVVEASLGYFITPLVNVLLGVVILKERLRRWQVVSVGLAACGVAYLAYAAGSLPWVSLTLAFTFGMYGLLRKVARADSLTGLTVETTILAPLGAVYLVLLGNAGTLAFLHVSARTDVLLGLTGVMTAVPLIWFAIAARRLPLTTMGFLQYLAPSGQFVLGVTVFKEPLTVERVIAFGLIWTALAVYSVDAMRSERIVVEAK